MSDRIAVMQAGKIRQIGTPEEIYEHPATAFVADFIGETNLLPATGAGDATYRLAEGQDIKASQTMTGAVSLAIRPERLRLVGAGQGTLQGIVEAAVYQGTDTTTHVRVSPTIRLRIRTQNAAGAPRLGAGDAVGVVIPEDAVRVFSE